MATAVACHVGRESLAMARAVGCRPVTANIGVILCQICGGQTDALIRNSPSISVLLCHSTDASYSSSPARCLSLDGQTDEAWEPSDKETLLRISGEPWTEKNTSNFVRLQRLKWQVSVRG